MKPCCNNPKRLGSYAADTGAVTFCLTCGCAWRPEAHPDRAKPLPAKEGER